MVRPTVINLGVCKSGTSSLHEFFLCNGWRSVHDTGCGDPRRRSAVVRPFGCDEELTAFVARHHLCSEVPWLRSKCFTPNKTSSTAVLEARFRQEMGGFEVYAELNNAFACHFPQVEMLHRLMRRLPDACYVLTSRLVEHWLQSVMDYRPPGNCTDDFPTLGANLLEHCPLWPQNETGLARWYVKHLVRARAALRTVRCALEVEIESPHAASRLASLFPGTNASCWERHNAREDIERRRSSLQADDSQLIAA